MEYHPNCNHVAQNTWHIDEVFGDIQGRVWGSQHTIWIEKRI